MDKVDQLEKQPVEPIVELFHMVKSLVPDDQELAILSPDTKVKEALALMEKSYFSQLPVVSGNAVLGILSYRSLTRKLNEWGPIDTDFRGLPVDEFMESFAFVQPVDKWETILKHLDRDDGVLVGHRNNLQGIVTGMDVLTYLHRLASPFVMLAEIELSLRRIIEASLDDDQFSQSLVNSLNQKYGHDEMPASPKQMTFNDYVQIIGDGRNWPHFETAFGKGDWLRKRTAGRLKEVRDLRNDVFHFRRQLEDEDYETLIKHRDWLEMKSRSFEGRRYKPKDSLATDGLEPGGETKTKREIFMAACEPTAADFFSWLVDKAEAHNMFIYWGTRGFSVRKVLQDKKATFVYGFPPDEFHIYFDDNFELTAAKEEEWRQELMAYGVLKKRGQTKLKAWITPANAARLREVFEFQIERVTALTRYPLPIQAEVQGKIVTAELMDVQGRVFFNGQGYRSPSGAGKDASGWKSTNGWVFWQFYDEAAGEWRPIDDLRK